MKKKTVLVTGASRGIGFAIVDGLKKQGLGILAPDRKELNFHFKKSGVCFIDFDPDKGTGKFEWYYDYKNSEFVK